MKQNIFWVVRNLRTAVVCYDEQSARYQYQQYEKSYDTAERTNLQMFKVDLSNCQEITGLDNQENQIKGFITGIIADMMPYHYREESVKIEQTKTGWTLRLNTSAMTEGFNKADNLLCHIFFDRCLLAIHEKYPDLTLRVRVNKQPYCVIKPEQ